VPKEIIESGADIPVRQYVAEQTVDPDEFLRKVKHLNEVREEISRDELIFKDGRSFDRYSAPMFGPDKKYYGRVWYFHDITERKMAEQVIRDSEKKYRNIFENVQDIYYETDFEGNILDISPSIESFSKGHYTRAELIGKSMFDFYSDLTERENLLKNIKEKGSITDFEIILRNRDGSLIPCSVSSNINYDESGIPLKIIGSVRDITERKKAEEAISHERMMLRALIDNLPDPIYVQDHEGRKVIANAADVRNTGRSMEAEVLGKTDLELYSGESGRKGYDEDMKIIVSGKPVIDLEEEFDQPDGSKRWLLTTKIPLQDKSGKITGLVGIGHDITERKRVEAELLQSYSFSKSLLTTIPFGMHIVDEDGNVLFQSDNFLRLLGEKPSGTKCWEIYRDDKTQCADCPLTRGIAIGETESYESHGVLGNRIFEINHTGMMYRGKKAILEIFQDITERKEAEKELIRAKVKAEESDKLKTAFLHNISHEIRTPMNAIVGFSALLSEPDIDKQSRESYIDVIMQSSNHLLSIITDIVDISNIEANIIKTLKNDVNVNSVIRSLVNQYAPVATKKGIELSFENGLPDKEATIVTDNTKLTQVLSNLLNNAMKFTEKGSVRIWYSLHDKVLEFNIADTGIGIAKEHFKKIFDRFFQVQNTVSRLYEGTGLGLSISKAYVEHLGGNIVITSEPGKGSTFTVTIPYEKAVSVKLPVIKSPVSDGLAFGGRKVILVAEDVESNFKLIKYFLSGLDAEIIHAINGKEAVEKCLAIKNIDLILMDIKMPVMDGYTAVKLIREKHSKIPIIAQTAYADDRDRAIECGCSGFISKPFDKKALFKILEEFI
jgi:PAS domain S-box-containing protein